MHVMLVVRVLQATAVGARVASNAIRTVGTGVAVCAVLHARA